MGFYFKTDRGTKYRTTRLVQSQYFAADVKHGSGYVEVWAKWKNQWHMRRLYINYLKYEEPTTQWRQIFFLSDHLQRVGVYFEGKAALWTLHCDHFFNAKNTWTLASHFHGEIASLSVWGRPLTPSECADPFILCKGIPSSGPDI